MRARTPGDTSIEPIDLQPTVGVMATVSTKRTRTLVDSEVQGSLLRRVIIHWLVFFVCNSIALLFWIRLFEQPDADWGQTVADTARRFLPFFIVTVALIPAFAWDTLKLSHRFAGPITRLHNTLKDIKEGRSVSPLRFRESDFWQEIASNFNAALLIRHPDSIRESDSDQGQAESNETEVDGETKS